MNETESLTDTAPMALLAHGVPLSLLLDLAVAPRSGEILEQEHGDADWLVREAS